MENLKENIIEVSKPGYKHTKLGWIPDDWKILPLGSIGEFSKGKGISKSEIKPEGLPCLTYGEIYTKHHDYIRSFNSFIDEESSRLSKAIFGGEVLFAGSGETLDEIGKCVAYLNKEKAYVGGDIIIFKPSRLDSLFLSYLLNSNFILRYRRKLGQGHSVVHIYSNGLKSLEIPIPPFSEQQKIARILSTWDKAIEKTEQLIQAKTKLKKGLMQQLLTGKKRFKEFDGEELKKYKLGDISNCLDNRRKPVNQEERRRMKGDIPYCGANGIMDYVNDYLFDEDIILIAEDGGYFDEFPTRPIAYRMKGKCWVNNHAHVLKAKNGFNQDFLFNSLVHKNIIRYLNGGTRSKLNKSEMLQIEVFAPENPDEQKRIGEFMNSAQEEINLLEAVKIAIMNQKTGLMQKLLTGEVRVITN